MDIDIKIIAAKAQINLERVAGEAERQFGIALREVVVAAFNEGKRLAMERLNTTSKTWLKAFNMQTVGENTYLLQLGDDEEDPHGFRPSMIEGGFSKFDMKPGLLAGPRAKMGKNGPYNTVPFEHSVGGKPRDLAAAIRQQGLNAIIKEKNLKQIARDALGKPIQGTVARIRTGSAYQQISNQTRELLGNQVKNMDGLTKTQKTYAQKTESRYLTFRRVSKNSDPSAWIHPGFEGAKIFPTLEQYLNREIEKIMKNILG